MQTLLIVDDAAEITQICALILREAGFACLVAHDVRSALAVLDERAPTLVLSDIYLPDGDGFQIARDVRNKLPDTPVILMTAHPGRNLSNRAVREGVACLLRKPFSNVELVNTIRSLRAEPQIRLRSAGPTTGFRAC